MTQTLLKTSFKTPLGVVEIEGDSVGISKISITEANMPESTYSEVLQEVPEDLKLALTQLKEYFSGSRKQFSFRLNPSGTDFQKKVWKALEEIPFGTTCSYLELAARLGDVKAIRAVAAANGKNPLWVVVPCHRVIGTNGALTGYAGGLWRKKWLLEFENPPEQQSLF